MTEVDSSESEVTQMQVRSDDKDKMGTGGTSQGLRWCLPGGGGGGVAVGGVGCGRMRSVS